MFLPLPACLLDSGHRLAQIGPVESPSVYEELRRRRAEIRLAEID
jgi:hypothetical protein